MIKINYLFIVLGVFYFQKIDAQSVEILGLVKSEASIENIHVINKTSQIFTTTNIKGQFTIIGKLNDTITFSSIQHQPKEIIITNSIISNKVIYVILEEQINELDQVTIGKILTGDLSLDINSIEGDPPINFYDVGIPGYKGEIATQSERRLAEAGEFKPIMLLGLIGGSLPLNPIINGITGRTKMLKNRVEMERKADLLDSIKVKFTKDFFTINKLDETLRADFFYFCEEDSNFELRCKNKTDLEILEFLKEKYIQYQQNLNSNKY